MSNPASPQVDIARAIAKILVNGFERHYRIFCATALQAKIRFELQDWQGELNAVRERVQYYDDRVRETVKLLQTRYHASELEDETWQVAKLIFINLLIKHEQPELAETFFNSVCCRILDRVYFHNDYIFTRPTLSTEYIQSNPPTYISHYLTEDGLHGVIRRILHSYGWRRPFVHLRHDTAHILRSIYEHLGGWPDVEVNMQIRVLSSPFYRNKSAYIIGKAINGYQEHPFALSIRHGEDGLYVDTLILERWRISLLFSLSRAYFMVDMRVPSAYVEFLRSIMPGKPSGEIYTMLGLGKQGKTQFYRTLTSHLLHSNDQFIIAPGIRGLVMAVFTLPSFPYVFKLIKDHRSIQKDIKPETVMRKYQLVKQVDRVGRMADTLEFSYVALPLARFCPNLLQELQTLCSDSLKIENDLVIISHLYIERRMTPLNIYLDNANAEQIEHAVREYGDAIREMAQANIFPGDMLWKNFGITRYGRVVFYDYDEIEYMTDCRFRTIPPPPYPEAEMSGEVWYSVERNDVFPEEFGHFLLAKPAIKKVFMQYHADLLTAAFWQKTQEAIRAGHIEDFYPYPQKMRFCNLPPFKHQRAAKLSNNKPAAP